MAKGEILERLDEEEDCTGELHWTCNILIAGTSGSIIARLDEEKGGQKKNLGQTTKKKHHNIVFQGIQRVSSGPMYPKGTHWSKVSKGYLVVQGICPVKKVSCG